MPEPETIFAHAGRLLEKSGALAGKHVLVTAGPTREAIDPVRYISNRSSGKMGYAIAEAAKRRGANVTLVTGPASIIEPSGVTVTRVNTAAEMHDAVMRALPSHQIVVGAAAVADYAPAEIATTKIKSAELTLSLKKNPDILAAIGSANPRPFVVAFAAETDSVESNAKQKLERKNADLIVANDVSDASIGFDADQNEVIVIARDGSSTKIERAPKLVVANRILDLIVAHLK